MALSFLIPFAIALVAAYIGYQSREEIIKVFSMIVMAISLLVSFAWAPWFVQILVLVTSLGGMRYFCDRHSCRDATKLR
jgi:hypothetical protein